MVIMDLQEQIRSCTKCPLHKLMPAGCRPVPGIGPLDAKLMFIGEALGADESIMEEPFVGQCGQLLDKMLKNAGLSRELCYITNMVKCRPVEGKKNRPPTKNELANCLGWVAMELQLVQPKVIFPLGRIPTGYLIGMKAKDKLGDYVGKETKIGGMTVVPLYHPSFLMQHSKSDIQTTEAILRRYAHG